MASKLNKSKTKKTPEKAAKPVLSAPPVTAPQPSASSSSPSAADAVALGSPDRNATRDPCVNMADHPSSCCGSSCGSQCDSSCSSCAAQSCGAGGVAGMSSGGIRPEHVKVAAVGLLAVLVLILFWYVLTTFGNQFNPGASVDPEAFKANFAAAKQVYIVMDVRNVADENTNHNILQCGVDFAGSSGMGGKEVTYVSLADRCYASSDTIPQPVDTCLSKLKGIMTIYVKEGSSTSYYDQGMVVGVGSNYTTGTCGIKIV